MSLPELECWSSLCLISYVLIGQTIMFHQLASWDVSISAVTNRIAITIGGCGQILAQYFGYSNIRKYHRYKEQIAEKHNALLLLQQKDQEQQDQPQSDRQPVDNQKQPDQPPTEQQHNTSSQRSANNDYKELLEEIEQLEEKRIRAVIGHVKGRITLFIPGCGIPSFIRLIGEIFPNASAVWVILLIVLLLLIEYRYAFVLRSSLHLEVPKSTLSSSSTPIQPDVVIDNNNNNKDTTAVRSAPAAEVSALSL